MSIEDNMSDRAAVTVVLDLIGEEHSPRFWELLAAACRARLPQIATPAPVRPESQPLMPAGADGVDYCDDILDLIDELPERGREFGEDVMETVKGIRETIENTGRVTEPQRIALRNIRDGVQAWFH